MFVTQTYSTSLKEQESNDISKAVGTQSTQILASKYHFQQKGSRNPCKMPGSRTTEGIKLDYLGNQKLRAQTKMGTCQKNTEAISDSI